LGRKYTNAQHKLYFPGIIYLKIKCLIDFETDQRSSVAAEKKEKISDCILFCEENI